MTEKVLVTVEVTYGKGSGSEVDERYVIEDTPENRQELVDEELNGWGVYKSEDFVQGKINIIEGIDEGGGDWDDPTGRHILLTTKEEELKMAEIEYNRQVELVEKLFEEENK